MATANDSIRGAAVSSMHSIHGTAPDLWAPGGPEESVQPIKYLLFLKRNLLTIALVSIAVAALLLILALYHFDRYSARALVIFDPHSEHVTNTTDVLPRVGADAIAIQSVVEIAGTDSFLGKIVDKFKLLSDPEFAAKGGDLATRDAKTISNLKKHISIERLGDTYLVSVTVVTKDPNKSARIANGAARMIVQEQAARRAHVTDQAQQWLTAQLASLSARVQSTSKAAAALKAKLKITDAGQGVTLQERRVTGLGQQLVAAEAIEAQTRTRLKRLLAARANGGASLPSTLQTPTLAALRQSYDRLSRQLANRMTVLGSLHPEVQSLKAQVAAANGQVQAEIARLIAGAKADADSARQQEAIIAEKVREAQNKSGLIGEEEVQLSALERMARADRSLYDQLLLRQKQVSELSTLRSADVRIASPAHSPVQPDRPPLSILVMAGGGLGLLAGIGFAFMRENLRPTLTDSLEAERRLGVPVAGILPFSSEAPPRRDGRYPRREVARWLSDVCALAVDGAPSNGRAVLVTSARAGEGKSTVASSVAACIARSGDMVLLIEANKGESAPRFGLLDILKQGGGLPQALIDVDGEEGAVTILPFGTRGVDDPAAVAALMRSGKLRELLRECRRWFDVIVIDGPAIVGAGYGGVLASLVDLCVVCVAWNDTEESLVREALRRLGSTEAVVVLNKVDLRRYVLFNPSYRGVADDKPQWAG